MNANKTSELKAPAQATLAASPYATAPTIKAAKPEPVIVDKGIHALIVKDANGETKLQTAQNATYEAFKAVVVACLATPWGDAAHTAILLDIRATFGEHREAAGVQRITILNNLRTIALGKAATSKTLAQPAQGVQVVLDTLDTVTSLPALKKAAAIARPHNTVRLAFRSLHQRANKRPLQGCKRF